MGVPRPRQLASGTDKLDETESIASERAQSDALFLSIGDGAIATDSHGMITRVNKVALDMLGFSEQEVVGKWFPRTIVAVDENNEPLDIADRPITQAFISGKSVSAKALYRRKDGTPVPISLTISPFIMHGRPIGAVQVFRDITTEVEIDRAKDEFISLASHQLRTPLTIIRTYAEMLEQGYGGELTERQATFVNAVSVSIVRMAALINSLLSVARIESGQVHVRRKKTDLQQIVQSIIDEMMPRINEKSIHLKMALSPLPAIVTDPVLVKEVFANLLSNAIKYTPENGTIRLKIWCEDHCFMASVQDTGYGIPASEQDKVFTKFYRGSNILKRDTDGTGIGLYLVKRIVENLDGDIWFKSGEQTGTTFVFKLPISQAAQPASTSGVSKRKAAVKAKP